ncbi:hypothetical protein [Lachnobacterium bovis]|jgi:hypothetical protein|uniref:D-Ala-teichoic acid biosynthesis protein n=2 Tax=Lachnobacterium bovis TaxID=140626 RepID=A0A1H3GXU0_9FIRM|nr:hypothetical protein [Lachnobacterium bovis]SDY07890.1 hypothetical protein SAMN02910414_00700 [Lachnobacterium bovis DSM 14045]SES01071.1 hypothetical protein SAMN02910429_01787 [Lachnobacterium bovis]
MKKETKEFIILVLKYFLIMMILFIFAMYSGIIETPKFTYAEF